MVNVAVVGGEDRLAAQEAPDDREPDFKRRQRQRHHRSGHTQHVGGFLAPEDAVAAEQGTDEQAAGIAPEKSTPD